MKRFVVTPTARADLREILADIADDNPDAALRMHARFWDAFQQLGLSPGIGHYHEELLSRDNRFWNVQPYVVVYAWDKRPIRVIAIVHGARDVGAYLSSRDLP